jgi:hypothetical protein
VWTAPDGAGGRIMALDFTGGPAVRAAKQQAETEEHLHMLAQQLSQPVMKLAPAPAVPPFWLGAALPDMLRDRRPLCVCMGVSVSASVCVCVCVSE